MMSVKTWLTAFFLAALFAAMSATVYAEDATVAQARELYASAAYDDALRLLDSLRGGNLPIEERQAISLYRALCLVALGRATEADRAVEALVAESPLYRPPMGELPPRMRTAFTETRKRMLPGIIQRLYGEAKAAFDREEYRPAAEGFTRVLEAMADADVAAAASQPPLSDLKVLANGFHDLSMKELELPPPPAPVPVAVAPALAPKATATMPARDFARVYTADDPEVAHPGVILQSFPAFRGRVTTTTVGLIEVVIDATGAVESARMRTPVHPAYDGIALSAAKKWRYQPAVVDGVPVKFMKRVQVTLSPTP
jgi:TonB family protein